MLTDPVLRSKVDQLWEKFWTGGLSNPMDAIEQFSYLLFLKRLDDVENTRQRAAERQGSPYTPALPAELRWNHWTNLRAEDALRTLKETIFPCCALWVVQILPSSATWKTPNVRSTSPPCWWKPAG